MNNQTTYGDGRALQLPAEWPAVSAEVLAIAETQTLQALSRTEAVDDLAKYYDRSGSYSGTLFLDARPNNPDGVDASDLYAVTTLSMDLDARHGRLLLDEGEDRSDVSSRLARIGVELTISDLDASDGGSAETLLNMWGLYDKLRTLLPGASNRWVTAAKLCARKRPSLFPVRDNKVCRYLGAGRPLSSGDGWPGDFSIDMQIYAYLMTHPDIASRLDHLRSDVTSEGVRVDEENLRLLDSALWMAAK